ncbi:MAG: hypothetical protein WC686_05085 [Candidatus Shapirobacteria bacterium]|jgi:hypothetical protein
MSKAGPEGSGVRVSDQVRKKFLNLTFVVQTGKVVTGCKEGIERVSYCGPNHQDVVKVTPRKGGCFEVGYIRGSCDQCFPELAVRRREQQAARQEAAVEARTKKQASRPPVHVVTVGESEREREEAVKKRLARGVQRWGKRGR